MCGISHSYRDRDPCPRLYDMYLDCLRLQKTPDKPHEFPVRNGPSVCILVVHVCAPHCSSPLLNHYLIHRLGLLFLIQGKGTARTGQCRKLVCNQMLA